MFWFLGSTDAQPGAAAADEGGDGRPKKAAGLKAVLEGLEELWDENQYAEEFSLDSFVEKLAGNG